MAMPQEEEIKKQRKAPSSSFMPYLLQRLDGMEANLRGAITGLRQEMREEIGGLRQEIGGLRQETNGRIDGLHQEMNSRIDGLHREVHNTTLWIVGTIIATAGVAVAVMQALK